MFLEIIVVEEYHKKIRKEKGKGLFLMPPTHSQCWHIFLAGTIPSNRHLPIITTIPYFHGNFFKIILEQIQKHC